MPNGRHTSALGDTRMWLYRQFGFEQFPFAKCKQAGVRSGVKSWERSQASPAGQVPFWRKSLHIATFAGSWIYRHLGPLRHVPVEWESATSSRAYPHLFPEIYWIYQFREKKLPVVEKALHGSLIFLTIPRLLAYKMLVLFRRANPLTERCLKAVEPYRWAFTIPERYRLPFLLL